MTTTTTATTSASAAPAPPKQHKIRNKLKNVPFEVALVIVTIIAIIVLNVSAQTSNVSVYVNSVMWLTFAFYNIAVMAYPIILLARRTYKGGDYRWLNLAVRGGVIVFSIIFTWSILMYYVRATGADDGAHYAQDLWKLAFIGPFVAPFLAIALNGLAAFFLVHYAADNPQLKEDQENLPTLQTNLRAAQVEQSRLANEQIAATAEVERLKPIVEAADTAHKEAAKEFAKATKALGNTKLTKKRAKVIAKLKKNEEERATLDSILTKMRDKANTLATNQKVNRDADIAAKDAELKPLLKEQKELEKRLKELESDIDASPEKAALDAATVTSKAAEKDKARQDKLMAAADKASLKADGNVGRASALVDGLQTQLTDLENRIREATAEAKSRWRFAIEWAVLAFICLVVAYFVCDPSWYGFKLDAF